MFADNRSKRIVFISHCLLNQNSISDNTADFKSQFREVIDILMNNNIGIIQMKCPELMCLGISREDENGGKREVVEENSRIRMLLEKNSNIDEIISMVDDIVYEIKEYLKYGFSIIGVIGINRSPSCGIESTSKEGKEIPGMGVFAKLLKDKFDRCNINLPMIGIKTGSPDESIMKVKDLIVRKSSRKNCT